MKKLLPVLLLLSISVSLFSQITNPVIRANYGVDADLRANYFNGTLQPGNADWYNYPGTAGLGEFVIDTMGAAAIMARYATDMNFRRSSFARTMRFPAFTVINNRTLLDAIFVRDFHGDDSTVFAAGSNKNGDNPLVWSTPVSQGIPDKNDILDMFVHVRRAGPNGSDSLWLFGGLSLDNTTGNRYFDFEMYQTDFYYDRAGLKFGGVGPDEGHTSWEFDAAGNITKAGDIILSAEYQSSSLSFVEARIWINRSKLSIIPAAFSWSGDFDGSSAGSTFGYAAIQPKTAGAYYTGLQCGNNTWGGPFGIILQNEALETDYSSRQFVELSVNLTKLGLDPLTTLGGDPCGMPFRRVIVKTRASASFTAELKDFVAPFAFFDPPKAAIATETPFLCENGGVAEINVTNPLATSTYQWTTPNGNIVGGTTGTTIVVDTPGTYVVIQHLLTGCGAYASDTVHVLPFAPCSVLGQGMSSLQGVVQAADVQLRWKTSKGEEIKYFEIEKSVDAVHFSPIGRIEQSASYNYLFTDNNWLTSTGTAYYRLRFVLNGGLVKYSNTIRFNKQSSAMEFIVFPNPSRGSFQMQVTTTSGSRMKFDIVDAAGKLVASSYVVLQPGTNSLSTEILAGKEAGIYYATAFINGQVYHRKIMVMK
jgi:hypothetical protein